MFPNFGSKAEPFEVTILPPFTEFVEQRAATWNATMSSGTDPIDVTRAFVEGFRA